MDQIDLPFEDGILDPAEEFKLFMKREEQRYLDEIKKEVSDRENPRPVYISRDLYICGNRISKRNPDGW